METKVIDKEILKIHHDEVIDKLLKEYPPEQGYDVVISSKSIDSKTERITCEIKQVKHNNNIKVR